MSKVVDRSNWASEKKRKCKRCLFERHVRTKGDVNPLCAPCTQIVAREEKAKVPHAVCLVTLHKVERWFAYDRMVLLAG